MISILKYTFFTFILFLVISCAPDIDYRTYRSSLVRFANNLPYDIEVQAYCYRISDSEDWCKKEEPYSEPIRINQNDTLEVIRYARFTYIKVFKVSDGSLLNTITNQEALVPATDGGKLVSTYFIDNSEYVEFPFDTYIPTIPNIGGKYPDVDNTCQIVNENMRKHYSGSEVNYLYSFNLNHPDFAIEEVEE